MCTHVSKQVYKGQAHVDHMARTCMEYTYFDTLAVGILYSSTVKEATHSYTQYLTVKVA